VRRLALSAAVLAVLGLGLAVLLGRSSGTQKGPVDVVFDDARGLRAGQLVQIAGARVGKIDTVSVTPGYKARIHMQVEKRFLPFAANATCTIKPQGLIAENYVACDPGSADAKPLRGRGGQPPTVPVDHTTQPVSLTDLFEVWNAPVRDRLRILLSELGMATAGRGQDFNAVLRRANPALKLARRAIGTLERQRQELAQTVDYSTRITRELARRPRDIEALIHHAAAVSGQTAAHRGALAQGVRVLPGLLAEARPALVRINSVMDAGQPLLESLQAAAPDAVRVSKDIPKLAGAARPALRKLGPALTSGARTARSSRPTARLLRDYAANSLPSAKRAGELFPLLERNGFPRNLGAFFFNAALAASRYDAISHILPAHITLSQNCSPYATTPKPGCGPSGGAAASGHAASRARAARGSGGARRAAPAIPKRSPGSSPGRSSPTIPAPEAPAAPAPGGRAPSAPSAPLNNLLEMLLG
jgi:virulence factor Mce-like protein